MMIRVVSKREEIEQLDPAEKIIHLAFRPSNEDIFNLVKRCQDIEVIQIPASYRRTVSKSIKIFMEMQGIQLIEGDVWGHRKDINEYYTVPSNVLEKIETMKAEGIDEEEIAEKLARETKLNKEMLLYVLSD